MLPRQWGHLGSSHHWRPGFEIVDRVAQAVPAVPAVPVVHSATLKLVATVCLLVFDFAVGTVAEMTEVVFADWVVVVVVVAAAAAAAAVVVVVVVVVVLADQVAVLAELAGQVVVEKVGVGGV